MTAKPRLRKERSSKRPDMNSINSIKIEIYITGSSVIVAIATVGVLLHTHGV
jgi:hypothetical protein